MTPSLSLIEWKPCWRIIPSRYPPVQLFDRVADVADQEAIVELESMTNPRIRDEVGAIRLVPQQDRVSGPGTSLIMAPFTHLNPEGSRFTDGSFGVLYAAKDQRTAIAETIYHRKRFMQATSQPAMDLDMRVYLLDLLGQLHDLRELESVYPLIFHDNVYRVSQKLANELRESGSNGIVYYSVRNKGGECAAVFRPRLLSNCRQTLHLCYVWDSWDIVEVYEKRAMNP